MSVSKISVKAPESVSLGSVVESVVDTSPVPVSELTPLVTAVGLGLQVGISPASAGTAKTHVKVSVASIRFIKVTPV
jgi:hypothetical protein